ncbi:hypothetical protein N234_31542 [Ralstonia pickettii DTP0602]|nr:hypothetical protein N234_31542 [Ralstonia pickettii DTP0602]
MAMLPQTAERLAQLGAHLEIDVDTKFLPQTVETLVKLARASGGRVTIHASNYLPQTLERLATIGGASLTIRI